MVATSSLKPPAPDGGVPGTAAFGKFMRVLQAVADAPAPVSVAGLAALVAMPRPTTYRIVAALTAEGLLAEAAAGGRLILGPRLISLAQRSWERSDLRSAAQAHLAALRDSLDETVHLALRSGPGIVYIDKLESRQAVRMASRIGTGVSLHSSAVGKAWLATLPPADLAALLPQLALVAHTDHTLVTLDAVKAEIARTRARDYATDLQENELDICCYGYAIMGPEGRALGCISVSMPRYRFEEIAVDVVIEAMRRCAEGIAATVRRSLEA